MTTDEAPERNNGRMTPPEAGFVFRDFERSRISAIQEAVAARPLFLSLAYFAVAMLWTAMVTIGSAFHGENAFAVNQSPHIAHFMLIVGVLVYPARLLWVPVLGYSLAYALPFVLHAGERSAWIGIEALTLDKMARIFALNLVTALATGAGLRGLFGVLRRRFRPYLVDFLTALFTLAGFIGLGLVLVAVLYTFCRTLPPETAQALGFHENYLEWSIYRVIRGGTVAAGFMLAVIEAPSLRDLGRALALSMLFPALALVHVAGFGMYPMLDAVALALLIAMFAPIRIAALTALLGVSFFSALTGHFLNDTASTATEGVWHVRYSVAGLVMTVLLAAMRSLHNHGRQQSIGAIRRLNRVRDFASVGVFSINLTNGQIRADRSTRRILGIPADCRAGTLLDRFDGVDRQDLAQALKADRDRSAALLLRLRAADDGSPRPVIRLFLWYERAPSGEAVAYGLAVDVTVEHEQERALKATLAELSSRQQRQAQIFSIISHELRTPASILSMLLEELERDPADGRTRKQLRDAMDQLLGVLADMRQTVNPTQNLPVRIGPYKPAELAESLRTTLAPMARDAGMTIDLSLGQGADVARLGDSLRLRQALSNLLRNAILHSRGSVVRIAFRAAPPDTEGGPPLTLWEVTDNGIGIPEADVDRLFEAFERGGADPGKRVDGSGLGLFIARNSIEVLGGSIMHFRPGGGGAGYRITLPGALAEEGEAPAPPAPAPATVHPEARVLLAEDNGLVAEVMRNRLLRFVGTVEVVGNGKDALDRIAEGGIDLLITDLFMPEIDGDELIRQLRARGHGLPVIGLTAAVVGDDLERMRAAGATVVLAKPVDMAQLRDLVERCLAPERRDAAE